MLACHASLPWKPCLALLPLHGKAPMPRGTVHAMCTLTHLRASSPPAHPLHPRRLHRSCYAPVGMSEPAPPASLAAKAVLMFGTVVFFHAAYSTYEFLGLQKSLGLLGKSVPVDVSARHSSMRKAGGDTDITLHDLPIAPQIKVEAIVSLLIILVGTVLTASPLRDITWASEYQKR